VNHINEHLYQSMCLKCPPPTHTNILDGHATGLSQCPSQTKFASSIFTGLQRHESLFHTRLAIQHPK